MKGTRRARRQESESTAGEADESTCPRKTIRLEKREGQPVYTCSYGLGGRVVRSLVTGLTTLKVATFSEGLGRRFGMARVRKAGRAAFPGYCFHAVVALPIMRLVLSWRSSCSRQEHSTSMADVTWVLNVPSPLMPAYIPMPSDAKSVSSLVVETLPSPRARSVR